MRISDWSSGVCSSDLLDGRADGAGDEVFHTENQPVHVGRLGIEGLAAREGEEPLGQRRGALCGGLRTVDEALYTLGPAFGNAPFDDFQAADDACQQIIADRKSGV